MKLDLLRDDAGRPLRFPRSMIANPGCERLLVSLGVEIVDGDDAELEDFARAWLATIDPWNVNSPSAVAVTAALRRIERRAA